MSSVIVPLEGLVSPSSEIQLVIDTPSITTVQRNDHHNSSAVICFKRSLLSIITRLHAGYFRISISLAGQALLWKILDESAADSTTLGHVLNVINPFALIILWSFSFLILLTLSFLYVLRCFFRFNMVKGEFFHHVGVNYLFAPFISWLLLLQSVPYISPQSVSYGIFWWFFVVPVVALDVKIYGQWFTKGRRFLTAVANPTILLSVIGNLVGARAAAKMGWQETAVCLFSLGIVHYLVLFVTLYQRLSGSDQLPVMLRPVFFLFFAAPSMASLAWAAISGTFDTGSKMLFFLSLFIFTSLVCRPTLFKKSMRRFSVAWWAYSFPVTILAQAAARYSQVVKGVIPHALMLTLLVFSLLVAVTLVVLTLLNTRMLLPDDDPIFSVLSDSTTTA